MIAADGRRVWIHDIVNGRQRGGAPRMLRWFHDDISKQKYADEELRAPQCASSWCASAG